MKRLIQCDSFDFVQKNDMKTNQTMKEQLLRLKAPYLRNIQQSKQNFLSIKNNFQNRKHQKDHQEVIFRQSEQSNDSSEGELKKIIEKGGKISQRVLTETSNESLVIQRPRQAYFREWQLQNNSLSFKKKEQISQKFKLIFQQRVSFSKSGPKGQSFKLQQKQVIQRIYNEICNKQQKTITFISITTFFNQCPLFYQIYNIHPNSLPSVLNDAAHRYQDRLTQEEFMNLFLLNNRTSADYDNYRVQEVEKMCVFGEDGWAALKETFTIFDTFGNETIRLRQLLQKLRLSLSLRPLLDTPVLRFPAINRIYTLRKVVFDIQHKLNLADSLVRWDDIRSLISNFQHKRQPTIDLIGKFYLSSGKITSDCPTFMLRDQVLTFLKQIYSRLPKYCISFIKVSNFCQQILDSSDSRPYLSQIVRNNPIIVTFSQAIIQLRRHQLEFMDLDQILQWFSIRDLNAQAQRIKKHKEIMLCDQDSEDEGFRKILREKEKEKGRKMIGKIQSKYVPRGQIRQVTKVEEFRLSKGGGSLRSKKVKEMVREIQEKELRECSKKFKANSIPASINNEKYLEYRQKLDKEKEMSLIKLNEQRAKDAPLLHYLQTNTRLFEKGKPIKEEQTNIPIFQSKPVPWFAQVCLLGSIQEDKKMKAQEQLKATKLKYLRQWRKGLPAFLQQVNFTTQAVMNRSGSVKDLLCQLQNNKPQKQPPKPIPDFKQLQKRFQQELEKRKNHIKPTIIKEFNLSTPKPRPTKSQITETFPSHYSNITKKSSPRECTNFIGSTAKYQAMVQAGVQKRQAKEVLKQQEEQSRKERKKNQKQFAKYMRKQLQKQLKFTSNSFPTNKKSLAQIDHKKQIAQIYRRVFTRPFLFQSNSTIKAQSRIKHEAKPININAYNPTKIYDQTTNRMYQMISELQGQKSDRNEYEQRQERNEERKSL